jgi:hypothetical protein
MPLPPLNKSPSIPREPSGRGTPRASNSSVAHLDRQVGRLYGESLFGPWQDPTACLSLRRRKRSAWKKRLGVVLVSAAVLTGGFWLTARSRTQRKAQDRAQVAKDVTEFLADGELDRLAQFLAILSPPAEPLQATDPYLDLIVRAEAVLFRYHDASRGRLVRITPHLSVDGAAPERFIAYLTVSSNAARSASYQALQALQSRFAKDPELWALMATAEEGHDPAAAQATWNRSFEIGPLWLPHRYQQCLFEARQRNTRALALVCRHMAKVAPDSHWTRLALALRDGSKGDLPHELLDGQTSPVPQHYEQLALVFHHLRTGASSSEVRRTLGRALAVVHDEPAFLLDAFDWLIAVGAQALATDMTSFEAWPRDNPFARARMQALQSAKAPETTAGELASGRAIKAKAKAIAVHEAAPLKSKKPAKGKRRRRHR